VKVEPRFRVWVVYGGAGKGGSVKFGDGRAALLERIEALGSFKKAVAEIGMSYRAAWGYYRDLERAAGVQLLERHPGGGPAGGTRLTAAGRQLLRRYRRFRHGLDAGVARQFGRAFGSRAVPGRPAPSRRKPAAD
jgi:molybdate transport system regulatory protein